MELKNSGKEDFITDKFHAATRTILLSFALDFLLGFGHTDRIVPGLVKRYGLLAFAIAGLTVSCDRNGVVSAYLRLREDSPLPSWLILPPGTKQNEVSVKITVYEATTTPSWKEKFEVRDKRSGRIIEKAIGSGYWHPDSEVKKAPAGTYPNWVIVEVNGKKDVYEQSEANDLLKIVKK